MSVTASDARKRLFPLIAEVNDDQQAIEIVSKNGTAFLVPEDEYRGLLETMYLLSSPRNAERLRQSLSTEATVSDTHRVVTVSHRQRESRPSHRASTTASTGGLGFGVRRSVRPAFTRSGDR